jgi:uncharacterized LabA/DUF88 family protein
MFKPKTERLNKLAQKFPDRIVELEDIFSAPTNVYIDYANVRSWSEKLGWHIEVKRLKQLLDSFDTIRSIKFYQGTLVGDPDSEKFMGELRTLGYDVRTKPVKIMTLSINVSSIPADSPDILKNFIRTPLLKNLKLEAVEYLNNQLRELNKQGKLYLEDRKCNFDVEIGRDILLDYSASGTERFVLWSGDSDFADPLGQLLAKGKKSFLFATARKVASELNALQPKGLFIYDIQKMRDFICWKKEMTAVL